MTQIFDIFGVENTVDSSSLYESLGYPRNPFREVGGEHSGESGPFYTGHIKQQLQDVQRWIGDIHNRENSQPLSLVGNIGAGKSRILKFIRRYLSQLPPSQKIVADVLLLSETGFARASIGGIIMSSLERTSLSWISNNADDTSILPIVWAVVNAEDTTQDHNGPLLNALFRVQTGPQNKREHGAKLVTRWLQRDYLTSKESQEIGLPRRIDWEGELIHVAAELLRYANKVGVLQTFYLFIDQLEYLFRPTFSELRRSRILTDLRGLVDEIDAMAPIGLCLAWTPDFGTGFTADGVDLQFRRSYEALYSRMLRRRVNLPLLAFDDAVPFAFEWVDALNGEKGYNKGKQPNLEELVGAAWGRLQQERKLFPGGGGRTTPRDLLSALAYIVEQRVGH